MSSRLTLILAVIVALGAGGAAIALIVSDQAPALSTLTGVLDTCDGSFCIDGRPLDFGAAEVLESETSPVDHDRDGQLGSRLQELNGVRGSTVTVEVLSGDVVATFNGYPWSQGATPTTTATSAPPPTNPGPGPSATTTTSPDEQPSTTAPAGSSVLRGVFTRCDPWMCVDDQEIYFGPWWFLTSWESPADIDGDGVLGLAIEELDSLVGSSVEVEVILDSPEVAAHLIDGHVWRDRDGPPPWAGGPSFGSDDD